jgi:hypothetical protein
MPRIYRGSDPNYLPHKYRDGRFQLHTIQVPGTPLHHRANAIRVGTESEVIALLKTQRWHLRMSDPQSSA